MNRRHFLALLGASALTTTLSAPAIARPRMSLGAPYSGNGPLCVGPFTEVVDLDLPPEYRGRIVAETIYYTDGWVEERRAASAFPGGGDILTWQGPRPKNQSLWEAKWN